jgi:hypothetical protein
MQEQLKKSMEHYGATSAGSSHGHGQLVSDFGSSFLGDMVRIKSTSVKGSIKTVRKKIKDLEMVGTKNYSGQTAD